MRIRIPTREVENEVNEEGGDVEKVMEKGVVKRVERPKVVAAAEMKEMRGDGLARKEKCLGGESEEG